MLMLIEVGFKGYTLLRAPHIKVKCATTYILRLNILNKTKTIYVTVFTIFTHPLILFFNTNSLQTLIIISLTIIINNDITYVFHTSKLVYRSILTYTARDSESLHPIQYDTTLFILI